MEHLSGTFTLADVPAGTHTIQVWHEEYGVLTQVVTVEADGIKVRHVLSDDLEDLKKSIEQVSG